MSHTRAQTSCSLHV